MEFVARLDEKRTQLGIIRKERPEVSARDERAGRGHEAIKGRRLRPVEIEQQKIAGLVEQNRFAPFEILPATAALQESYEHLLGGVAIDLAGRERFN